MSLGTWEPAAAAAAEHIEIDDRLLQRLAGYSREQRLEDLESVLTGGESQRLAGLMAVPHERWQQLAESLDSETLLHLIRFCAVAENLPGWEAGPRSPVIPLARALRGRGEKLSRELLLWLKQVNDNRFLPYGPL